MTNNLSTIKQGLKCCSHHIPLCEECPYINNCKDLEVDCRQAIINMESEISELNTILKDKLEYIEELEEMVGMPGE